MTLITMPAKPVPARIEWTINQPTQVNRSEFTSRRRVTILPFAPRIRAKVTLPTILGEEGVFAWRAFAADVEGQANKFRVIACERDQITGIAPVINGAGQGGRSLQTAGWGAAGLKLKRGQFVTIGDQLLILMQDVVSAGDGTAEIQFKPHIRVVPPNGAVLAVTRPYAVMSMTSDDTGWVADVGQEYAVSFECEESF
ncbi:conserved hypothetical protein [Altererythrobacter sp. B11]|uniref:hypothetical protein n=1 Tax=Altererythrobacter sp. B11 TaxID=2060312 RepID=UPI000DC739CA|nr:hypothetical protein [Altererythrobacter sp. B11]BBC72924.1 conserved hypothetical protein [Altererythrobacter sp. B11]